MKELVETLGMIAEKTGGEWKDRVLLENPNGNDLTDAFNEGVRTMAAYLCGIVTAIMMGKEVQHDMGTVNGGDR